MPGGQRGHLVEEEQLGPARAASAVAAHRLAPPPLEVAEQMIQAFVDQRLLEQRPRRRIMDDAAIAGEQAARRHGVDVAERVDAVLQWHVDLPFRGAP